MCLGRHCSVGFQLAGHSLPHDDSVDSCSLLNLVCGANPERTLLYQYLGRLWLCADCQPVSGHHSQLSQGNEQQPGEWRRPSHVKECMDSAANCQA